MSLYNPADPNTDKSHTIEQGLKVDPPTPDSALKADLTLQAEHPRDSQINTPDQSVAGKSKQLPSHSPKGDSDAGPTVGSDSDIGPGRSL